MQTSPRFFLIRIPKNEQKYKRENQGSLFIHPNIVFFSRNTQCGEIVSIGSLAAKGFPQAKVGMILLIHHFIEGSLDKRNTRTSFVREDDDFKYYVVSGVELPGTRVQCYGVYDGEKIIPHKDYIFLHKEIPEEKKEHEFFVLHEYEESTTRTLADLKKIKSSAVRLSKNKMNQDVKEAIERKDKQRENITLNFHKKIYKRYSVAYTVNEEIQDEVFALNIACNTMIDFLGNTYRVAETKYISMY